MLTPKWMSGIAAVSSQVLPQVKPSCGPLFFARSLEIASSNIAAAGSFGLIDTGRRKLLVTCHHVANDFRKLKQRDPDLMFCLALGSTPEVLDLQKLVDEDGSLDLATFDIGHLSASFRNRRFFPVDLKKIGQVKREDALLVVGYPGRNRVEFDKAIYWGTTPSLFQVADISERRIVAKTSGMRDMNWRRLADIHTNPYGGLSGSLCFVIGKNLIPKAVAVFVEDGLGIATMARLDWINPDGTIKRKDR